MTLDEVIVHEREVAKDIYVEAMLCHANPDDGKLDGCIEHGRYHEQLADWLEELKQNRIALEKANGYLEANYRLGYSKAIDDIVKILEQLKVGGENETN